VKLFFDDLNKKRSCELISVPTFFPPVLYEKLLPTAINEKIRREKEEKKVSKRLLSSQYKTKE